MSKMLPSGLRILAGLDVPACVSNAADPGFEVLWANDAFDDLGVAAVGRPLVESLGGAVAGTARAALNDTSGRRVDAVIGEAGHVEVSVGVIDGPRGKPDWIVCMVLDVDASSIELREARQSERRWRALVETVPAATYRADWTEEAALRYMSPQIEGILGRPPRHFLAGRTAWAAMVHPEDRDTYMAAEAQSYRTERPLDTEYRMVTADGELRWIYEREAIVRDDAGRPRYSHGLLIDVTHRRAGK